MRWKSLVRFGWGEKLEIISNTYLFISIETYHSINPSRISILSTSETKEQKFDDKYFKDYPFVIPDYPSDEKYFVDTTIINNTMTKGFGKSVPTY